MPYGCIWSWPQPLRNQWFRLSRVLLCINNRVKKIFKNMELNLVNSLSEILRNNLDQLPSSTKTLFWLLLNVRERRTVCCLPSHFSYVLSLCHTKHIWHLQNIRNIIYWHTELCMWAHTCSTFLSRLVSLCCSVGLDQAFIHAIATAFDPTILSQGFIYCGLSTCQLSCSTKSHCGVWSVLGSRIQ